MVRFVPVLPALFASFALVATGCGKDDDDAADVVPEAETEDVGDGGDDDVDGGGGGPACSLLTEDDVVEQLTASASDDSYAAEGYDVAFDDGDQVCTVTWSSVALGGSVPLEEGDFIVQRVDASGLSFTREEYDEEPIDGIGDEAFFLNDVPYAIVGDEAVAVVNFQRGEEFQLALLEIAASNL